MIQLSPEVEDALRVEAEKRGVAPERLADEAARAMLDEIAALRNRPTPQTLDDLPKPAPLPPGKTLADILNELGPWPLEGKTEEEDYQDFLREIEEMS